MLYTWLFLFFLQTFIAPREKGFKQIHWKQKVEDILVFLLLFLKKNSQTPPEY